MGLDIIGIARSSQQYKVADKDNDEERLTLIRLAKKFGRYGYNKVAELLRVEGWKVNHQKAECIWCEEGLPIQIYPGSPWENGYNERFNRTLHREDTQYRAVHNNQTGSNHHQSVVETI